MERVSVIGTTGSGKTTFSRRLAGLLDVPHIELDAIHWRQGGWSPLPKERFQAEVATVADGPRWVIEGNYSAVRPAVWARAETVIWLDYSFAVTFSRLLQRTLRRSLRREELWGGNQENLVLMLSRESILLWCLKTYRRNRQKFHQELARPENAHLRLLRFDSPHRAEIWLKGVAAHDCHTSSHSA